MLSFSSLRTLRGHWRKLVDFILAAILGVLVVAQLGSDCIPPSDLPSSIAVGFSAGSWGGPDYDPSQQPPAPGFSFGILDATLHVCNGGEGSPAYGPGADYLTSHGMWDNAFWFLTSYAFAEDTSGQGCGLGPGALDWCGGAWCWGFLNGEHFVDFLSSLPNWCNQAQSAFGDVEYYNRETDPYMWDSDSEANNRAVVQGFIYYVKANSGLCGKYVYGVYSSIGDWQGITAGASSSDLGYDIYSGPDWFWLADWTSPDQSTLQSHVDTLADLEMSIFSWQYSRNTVNPCDATLAEVLPTASAVGVNRLDIWTNSHPEIVC